MKRERAIDAAGVSFTYEEGTKALKNVDFWADRGQFVAMLASNGSGKTTLIKVLVGLLKPQEGRVLVGGRELSAIGAKGLYQEVGLVFQNPDDQLFGATVEEDVAFGPRNLGLEEAEVSARGAESLSAVNALELRKRAVHHLSFGEKKRVALAGVLSMHPSTLILDEPTTALDPEGRERFFTTLGDLNRRKAVTIIMITHDIGTIGQHASRLLYLDRRLIFFGGFDDFCLSTDMTDYFGEHSQHLICHRHDK